MSYFEEARSGSGRQVASQDTGQPEEGFVGNLIKTLLQTATAIPRTIGAAGYEGARFFDAPFTRNVQGVQYDNPFLTEAERKSLIGPKATLGSQAEQTIKNIAGTGSFAVPGGAGLQFIGRGALSGGLFGAAQEDATPESVAFSTAAGGAGAGLFKGAGKILSKFAGRPGEQLGKEAMAKVTGKGASSIVNKTTERPVETVATRRMIQTVSGLDDRIPYDTKVKYASTWLRHGVGDSLPKMRSFADKVTGSSGIVNKLKRDIIAESAGEVPFDKAAQSLNNLRSMATAVNPNILNKNARFISSLFKSSTRPGVMDPLDAFSAMQKMESKAAMFSKAFKRTGDPAFQELREMFSGVADDLRLALESGVKGSAAFARLKSPALMEQLNKISPELAKDVANAKSIAGLRSIEAPYVALKEGAEDTLNALLSPHAGHEGIVQLGREAVETAFGPGSGSARVAYAARGLEKGAEAIGGGIRGAAQNVQDILSKLPKVVGDDLGAIFGAYTAGGLGLGKAGIAKASLGFEPQADFSVDEAFQPTTPTESAVSLTDRQFQELSQQVSNAMIQYPKYAADIRSAYEVFLAGVGRSLTVPKAPSAANREDQMLGSSGLRALEQVETILDKDPNILAKQLIPGQLFSREYAAAGFRVADAILRLRTGATAPEAEIQRYMQQIIPQAGDDDQTIRFKLEQARIDLDEAFNLASSRSQAFSQPSFSGGVPAFGAP